LLERYRGLGTYVQKKKVEQPTQQLTSFSEYMQSLGYATSSKIVQHAKVGASAKVASELKIEVNEEVHLVVRVRYADNVPSALETAYFPFKLFPDLKEEHLKESFYDYAENSLTAHILYANQTIESTLADVRESELLETEIGAPLLLTKQTTYLSNETAIEYVRCFYRADMFKFKLQLERKTIT
ncbi:MAG: GntR family transcriptional regulator, partial [Bacilli bacterium]